MQWLEQMRANDDINEYLAKGSPVQANRDRRGRLFNLNWGEMHGVEMHGGAGTAVTADVLR